MATHIRAQTLSLPLEEHCLFKFNRDDLETILWGPSPPSLPLNKIFRSGGRQYNLSMDITDDRVDKKIFHYIFWTFNLRLNILLS